MNLVTFKKWDMGINNNMGVHWKSWIILGGRFTKKSIFRKILPKKGAGTVADLRRGLAKKRGGAFEGGYTPMHIVIKQ